jgi:hypothetical protein
MLDLYGLDMYGFVFHYVWICVETSSEDETVYICDMVYIYM